MTPTKELNRYVFDGIAGQLYRAENGEYCLFDEVDEIVKAKCAEVEKLRKEISTPVLVATNRLADALADSRAEVEELRKALNSLRAVHHECEDSWYSCPLSDGGCSNPAEESECTCGAARINEIINKALEGKE